MEDDLLKFAAVAEAGSFTAAANRLHTSQPALSMAVARLERSLGQPLLRRQTRPLQVTPAGQQAYLAAKEIMAAADNLKTWLAESGGGKQAVTIGMTDSIAGGLLRDTRMLQQVEAQAHVSLVVHNSRFLQAAVTRDNVDVAFTVAADQPLPDTLQTEPLGGEPLVLVCDMAQITEVQQLLHQGQLERFISYDEGSATSRLIRAALLERGLQPQTRFFSTSPDVMLRLVLLGQGVAALPYLQVQSLLAESRLAALVAPDGQQLVIQRPIIRLSRRRRRLPASLSSLSDQVHQLLAGLQSELVGR